MAHIAFSINSNTARLNASFELAQRLHHHGHRITYVTHACLGGAVLARGFQFVGLNWSRSITLDPDYETFNKLRFRQKLLRFPHLLRLRREIMQRFVTNDEIDKALEQLNPDLLLIDLEMQAYVIATRHLGIPTLLFFSMFSVWKTPGVPPLDSSLVPSKNWYHRSMVEWLWLRWSIQRFLDSTCRKVLSFGTDSISVLRGLARFKQFPFHKEADFSHWLTPCVFRSLPVITANALEMEFSNNHPRNVYYVGPLIPRGRTESGTDDRFSATLEKLTRRRQETGSLRPIIYCSISTVVPADIDFLRNVIRVFDIRNDWDMILGLGNKLKTEDLGTIPTNVFAFEWAPQRTVLKYADCAINHGGTTSINECVYFGVPMVVYSTKTMDHNGNAARVAYHRLGIVADRNKDTIDDVMHNIELVLSDPDLKANISAMREIFLEYEKSNHAASFVESFINGQSEFGLS